MNYRYTLETVTPLHIGTGEMMTPLEYFIDGNALVVPDLEKLFEKYPAQGERLLSESQRLDADSLARSSLSSFLDARARQDREISRYTVGGLYFDRFRTLDQLTRGIQDGQAQVRLALKTPDGQPYVPGSSLKGALKTAWAYAECQRQPAVYEAVKEMALSQRDATNAHKRLQAEVFQAPRQTRDAAYDLFRILHVGDTAPVSPDKLMVMSERVLDAGVRTGSSAVSRVRWMDYWSFYETLDEGLSGDEALTGRLAWQDHLLTDRSAQNAFGWNQEQRSFTLAALCAAANRFAADLCRWECEFFERVAEINHAVDVEEVRKFYQDLNGDLAAVAPNTCYLAVGHGSGWHKLTIGLLLERNLPLAEFAMVRKHLRLADRHTDFDYPKTRKLIMSGNQRADRPFGWVKLSFAPHA